MVEANPERHFVVSGPCVVSWENLLVATLWRSTVLSVGRRLPIPIRVLGRRALHGVRRRRNTTSRFTSDADPPLFDRLFYWHHYEDSRVAREVGTGAYEHYVATGGKRKTSSVFEPTVYRPTAAFDPAVTSLLDDYLDGGLALGATVSTEHEELLRRIGEPHLTPVDGPLHRSVAAAYLVDGSGPTFRKTPVSLATIANADVDLITIDVWDTLIARGRPADSAKLVTAERLSLSTLGLSDQAWALFAERVAIELECSQEHPGGEYLLAEVLRRQVVRRRPDLDSADQRILAEGLTASEVADEAACVVPILAAKSMFDTIREAGRIRVALVSDFYMTSAQLSEILTGAGVDLVGVGVVVSAEAGVSKHDEGRLLSQVRERYGVTGERHLHIGDNVQSDVHNQVRTGGIAVQVEPTPTSFPPPGNLRADSYDRCLDVVQRTLDDGALLQYGVSMARGIAAARVASAAWSTALFPVAVVAAAITTARRHGLRSVHYLSREGLFLSRVHAAIASTMGPDAPRAIALEVSRRSTFGPSVFELSPAEMQRLWAGYGNQSLDAMLVSLGADPSNYAEDARRFGINPVVPIRGIDTDERVRSFLSDHSVRTSLLDGLAIRREGLRAYIDKHADFAPGEAVVVDVGWRGTIQDNLAFLFPEVNLIGCYLGLLAYQSPQPPNTSKFGVAFDVKAGDVFGFHGPLAAFERPWTADICSPIGYAVEPDGVVVQYQDNESPSSAALIADYQETVVTIAPYVSTSIARLGLSADHLRPHLRSRVDAYYLNPAPGVSDIWFESGHDDTFGALNAGSIPKPRPHSGWLAPARYTDEVATARAVTHWPQGYNKWLPVQAAELVESAMRRGTW